MESEEAAETERLESSSLEAHPGPWLVFLRKKNKRTQSFFSLSKESWDERSISMMETNIYCLTPQGWLLMQDPEARQCFLWNPSTSATISLPSPPKGALIRRFSQCILSSEPTNPNCMVMYINSGHRGLLFCHPTSKQWTVHMVDRGWGSYEAIFCRGNFYLVTARGLAVIDIDPRPRITLVAEYNKEDVPQHRFSISFSILESCGEMFRVETYMYNVCGTTRPADIVVRKIDFDKKEWVTVDSIGGDRVFCLGIGIPLELNLSWSASALGVKGDCIYYIGLDNGLYKYDLEKETISSDLTCQYGRDAESLPFWLMPSA